MNKRISGYRQSETMQGTISARTPESPVLQCLLFLGVFLVAMLVESAPPTVLAFPYMMAQLLISHVDLSDSAAVMAFFTLPGWLVAMQLFCTGLATLLTVVYCTDVERRPLRSLGFARKNALRDYLTGAALGVGMIGGAVLVGVSTGSLEYAGSSLRFLPAAAGLDGAGHERGGRVPGLLLQQSGAQMQSPCGSPHQRHRLCPCPYGEQRQDPAGDPQSDPVRHVRRLLYVSVRQPVGHLRTA